MNTTRLSKRNNMLLLVLTVTIALSFTFFDSNIVWANEADSITLLVDASGNDSSLRAADAKFATLSGALSKAQSGDIIKLNKDLTELNDTVTFRKTVTLDLNGHHIDGTKISTEAPIIKVTENGNLTICDSTQTKGLDMKTSGSIRKGANGGILNEGTLTLSGGMIIGNQASDESGLHGNGGGIYNSGTLVMTGGLIAANETFAGEASGGGVYNSGSMTMKDGLITGNISCAGAGIYNVGKLVVEGGEITGNDSSAMGGGIYNWGKLFVGGTANITGNSESMLLVCNDSNVHISRKQATIIIGNDENGCASPEAGMQIGITAGMSKSGIGVISETCSASCCSCFSSDNSNLSVLYVQDHLEIA